MDHFIASLVWPKNSTQKVAFDDPAIWARQEEEGEGRILNSLAAGPDTTPDIAVPPTPHPHAVISDLKQIEKVQSKFSPKEEEEQGRKLTSPPQLNSRAQEEVRRVQKKNAFHPANLLVEGEGEKGEKGILSGPNIKYPSPPPPAPPSVVAGRSLFSTKKRRRKEEGGNQQQ